jgi:hypothetical protein
MLKMWQLWLAFLVLGIADGEAAGGEEGGEGGEAEPGGEEPGGEEELPGDDLDSLIETIEPGGEEGEAKPKPRANDAIRTARERAQAADEARIRAEATLDAERRMRAPPQASDDQRLHEQEEARLRDPEVAEIEKWQIRSNRTLRANTQAANNAMATAADMQDKAAFDRLEFTKPKVYKAYADKVEKALNDMRQRGEKAPRLALLQFLIGKDVVEGNVKSAPAKRAPASGAGEQKGVNRGKPPGARSDVTGSGKGTRLQQLEKSLKGVPI